MRFSFRVYLFDLIKCILGQNEAVILEHVINVEFFNGGRMNLRNVVRRTVNVFVLDRRNDESLRRVDSVETAIISFVFGTSKLSASRTRSSLFRTLSENTERIARFLTFLLTFWL